MNVESWLEKNTFRCEPLHARITPAQCALNREKATKKRMNLFEKRGPVQCAECKLRPFKDKS